MQGWLPSPPPPVKEVGGGGGGRHPHLNYIPWGGVLRTHSGVNFEQQENVPLWEYLPAQPLPLMGLVLEVGALRGMVQILWRLWHELFLP